MERSQMDRHLTQYSRKQSCYQEKFCTHRACRRSWLLNKMWSLPDMGGCHLPMRYPPRSKNILVDRNTWSLRTESHLPGIHWRHTHPSCIVLLTFCRRPHAPWGSLDPRDRRRRKIHTDSIPEHHLEIMTIILWMGILCGSLCDTQLLKEDNNNNTNTTILIQFLIILSVVIILNMVSGTKKSCLQTNHYLCFCNLYQNAFHESHIHWILLRKHHTIEQIMRCEVLVVMAVFSSKVSQIYIFSISSTVSDFVTVGPQSGIIATTRAGHLKAL